MSANFKLSRSVHHLFLCLNIVLIQNVISDRDTLQVRGFASYALNCFCAGGTKKINTRLPCIVR